MAHNEFNSGARHGFNRALFAVRNVDKKIFDLTDEDDIYKVGKNNLYNIQKDMVYKIYEEISFEKAKEVRDED